MQPVSFTLAAVEWHALGTLPWVVVGACAVLVAVLWLYPQQVRATGGAARWLLPGLRGVALVVLVLAFLQPVVISPRPPEDAGAVAVLVDVSRSMGVADSGRGPAQWVMLADGLGLLPADARPESARALPALLEGLRALADAVVRADAELDYARLSGREVAEAQARADAQVRALREAIDAAAALSEADAVSARLKQVAGAAAATPRSGRWLTALRNHIEQAEQAVRTHQVQQDEKLYREDPRVEAACDALEGNTRLELVERALADEAHGLLRRLPRELLVFGYTVGEDLRALPLQQAGAPVAALGLSADDGRSELTAALPRAHERLRGRDLQAIILFSDGREVGGAGPMVSGLSGGGVPVFPVLSAPPRSTRDLVVTHVDVPASVFAGEHLVVAADVRVSGMRNAVTDVTLVVGDVERSRRVQLKEDATSRVEFTVPMENAGIVDVYVTAERIVGEATVDNNTLRRSIKVLDDKLQVAACAGAATWEFQYLRSALEKTRGIALQDHIVPPTAALPLEAERILELDVLILSDVSPASISQAQKDAIHRLVTERGGSVILLAGSDQHLNAYADDILLANLLPWDGGGANWRVWPGESPGFRPAPADHASDVLRLADEGELAPQWLGLPPMYRVLAMPDLKPNAAALLVERESGLPLLTEARLGAGRVFTWAAQESWRWRWKVGSRYHERFWNQLIRHAAEAPYALTNDSLAFDLDTLRAQPGGEVRLRARRVDGTGAPLRLQVMRGDQPVEEITLTATGPAGRFEHVLSLREPGRYQVQLADPDQPQAMLALPLEVSERVEAELADLSPDEGLMRRIAESSGGQLLTLESVSQLPGLLAALAEQRSKTVQWSLWDSPYLFGFVLSCLGLEWALRKRAGLA